MKIEFEIQRFAEDFEDNTDVEEQTTAQGEESTEQAQPTDGAEQPEQIPEELEFLDEPYRSEALKELKEYQQAQTQEQEQEPQPTENQPPPAQPQAQPVDEMTALRNEVNFLKAQLAQMQTQRQPPQPQPPQPQRQPQPEFSKDDIAKIKQAIHSEALRISGFSQKEVDDFLEFADDDDERRERWKFANQAAERNVWDTVHTAKTMYDQQLAQMRQQLQESQQSFNAFVTQETKEPDFKQVVDYSMNDYFSKLAPEDQATVGEAYYRINNNVASAKDAWIVKQYYQMAKADFRSNQQKTAPKAKAKTTPPPNLPKADLLQGTTGTADVGISTAELARLIETGQLEKIPKSTRELLENSTTIFKH